MLKDILSSEERGQLLTLIDESENIVICCHVSPDGDAVGSTLAWADYLHYLGKNARVIVPDQYPDFLHWLPNTEKILRYDKHPLEAEALIGDADLLFCLDLNDAKRMGDMGEAVKASTAEKVMIDHHLNPVMDCALTISHPQICSTSELIFRIVWQLGDFAHLTNHFAVPVYCGMMTDTGGFTYNSNDPATFFIISQLLTKGFDKDKVYRNVYNNYSENRLRFMGYVMYEKLCVADGLKAAYFAFNREEMARFHYIKGDAEGLVNMPLQIKGMKLSVSLREDTEKDNKIRVSLRSVDDFPCNKMAEMFFNGGGHLNASGGELHCSLDEAVETVKKAIAHFEDMLR
ncbi:MAG: DHH family phosphoesterase [Prevotella sp.]|nr:DHH family phosphoesterase [Prevotella sp.]